MSEEKKAVELKEKDLEKVAGGDENFWIDTWINCPQCGWGGAHAIRTSNSDDGYSDVYCEHCGFYAAKL